MSKHANAAVAADRGAHNRYSPNTFVERGFSTYFTTPGLAAARARPAYSNKLEFMVPNMFGARGVYVMPWDSISQTMTTTLHDRVLYERMVQSGVTNPSMMRQVRLKVGVTGLSGARIQEQSIAILKKEGDYRVLTHFLLVMQLLKIAGISARELIASDLNTEASRHTVRRVITKIAKTLSVPDDELYDRVEQLSTIVAPIGLPGAPEPGPLRALVDGLITFRDYLNEWALGMPPELGDLAQFEAMIAERTRELAAAAVARVDNAIAALPELVRTWDKSVTVIRATMDQVSWLLDGWDFLVGSFAEAANLNESDRQALITDSFAFVPVLPKEASSLISRDKASALDAILRRWVRQNEDWRTGTLDYDQVRRIEAIRAGMT